MNLFNIDYLKSLCKKYKLSPDKKYGQNFLISSEPIEKMIEVGELNKNDTVLEIGPGFGVLTFALSPLVKKVIAFEIEKKLEDYWAENKPDNVEIIWGNALKNIKFQMSNVKDKISYKVVANIPYQITSNLIRVLLELENPPEKIILMTQKEVAERICAKAGEMSILSISVRYYGEPRIISYVSRSCFWPEPKVDSAVIEIEITSKHENIKTSKHENNLSRPHVGMKTTCPDHTSGLKQFDSSIFFKFVKAGFANKRKQLWRNLSVNLKLPAEEIKKALFEIMGNDKVRAEDLGVEEWERLISRLRTKQIKN